MNKHKSSSGPSQTDEQRLSRGEGRMTLRMPLDALDQLDQLAGDAGVSRSQCVERLVRERHRVRRRAG